MTSEDSDQTAHLCSLMTAFASQQYQILINHIALLDYIRVEILAKCLTDLQRLRAADHLHVCTWRKSENEG